MCARRDREKKSDRLNQTKAHPGFFEVLSIIAAAEDERIFYTLKSLHYEKLQNYKGYSEARSLRLNRQFRLILELREDNEGTYVFIIDIDDYH